MNGMTLNIDKISSFLLLNDGDLKKNDGEDTRLIIIRRIFEIN
jgi:hypothetical protein